MPDPLTDTYLRDRLAAHLAREDAGFDFLVQFQTDAARCRLKTRASNGASTIRRIGRVAHIRIPTQTLASRAAPGLRATGRSIRGTRWRDHRPLGDFNRARRDIYRAMAAVPAQAQSP